MAMIAWFAACGGEKNAADCDGGLPGVPCSEKTPDEKARAALDAKDYDTAIEILDQLIKDEPGVYDRFPLAAAAHAGRAGISIFALAQSQLSGGSGSTGGGGLV